jgi:hypothetical protein
MSSMWGMPVAYGARVDVKAEIETLATYMVDRYRHQRYQRGISDSYQAYELAVEEFEQLIKEVATAARDKAIATIAEDM